MRSSPLRCLQKPLILCAFTCGGSCLQLFVVAVIWACISSLALPKSLISACSGWKKIPLPYSLTVLAMGLWSSCCKRP